MGPEDQHEQPAEKDGYEKWLDEIEAKKLAKIIAEFPPKYSQASELDADEYDAEFRRMKAMSEPKGDAGTTKPGTCKAFGHKGTVHEENYFCDGWVASEAGVDIGGWLTEAGFGGIGGNHNG